MTTISCVLLCIVLLMIPSYGKAYDDTIDRLLAIASSDEISDEMIPLSLRALGYYAVDGVLFQNKTLIRYPMNKDGAVYHIPEGITDIDQNAFDRSGVCEMREIFIPASCVSIGYDGDYRFIWETSNPFGYVSSYYVSEDNPFLSAFDGALFSKDSTILLQYPIAHKRVSYQIPDGVCKIEERAFMQCKLSNVVFPASLRSIGCEAFYMNEIESLQLNDGLRTIEDGAFNASSNLASVTLPSSLQYIGSYAFSQCFKLDSICLPEGVLHIDSWAFYGAPIVTLLLPASLTFVGDDICRYSTFTTTDEAPFYYVYQDSYAYQWVKNQSDVSYKVIDVKQISD